MSNSDPARETQVNKQKSELTAAIEVLGKVLSTLEDRLAPILTSETVGKDKDASTPETSLVPFADFLRAKRRGISGQVNKVESMTQRLEL